MLYIHIFFILIAYYFSRSGQSINKKTQNQTRFWVIQNNTYIVFCGIGLRLILS